MPRGYRFAALFGILAVCWSNGASAADHPDLSGVWGVFQTDKPGGLFGMPREPKLTSQGEEMVAAFKAKYDLTDLEPGAFCVPGGMPKEMFGAGGYPFEIIQQPGRITMLMEF